MPWNGLVWRLPLNDLNQGQKVTQEDFNAGNVVFQPLTFAEYRTYKTYPYKIKRYTNFQWDCITMPAGYEGGNVSQVDSLLMGISGNLLGQIIENGRIKAKFKRYDQALALADSEIGKILEDGENIDSNLKILQRTIDSYLQQ